MLLLEDEHKPEFDHREVRFRVGLMGCGCEYEGMEHGWQEWAKFVCALHGFGVVVDSGSGVIK
jgi:hypothetical protein